MERADLDAWDANLDDVLEPSNQTTGPAAAGMTLKAGECVRSGCSEPPVDGSEFCGGCRAYMLGDLGEDPVTVAAREHAESLANDFLEHDDGVVGCGQCGSPECRDGAIRSLTDLVVFDSDVNRRDAARRIVEQGLGGEQFTASFKDAEWIWQVVSLAVAEGIDIDEEFWFHAVSCRLRTGIIEFRDIPESSGLVIGTAHFGPGCECGPANFAFRASDDLVLTGAMQQRARIAVLRQVAEPHERVSPVHRLNAQLILDEIAGSVPPELEDIQLRSPEQIAASRRSLLDRIADQFGMPRYLFGDAPVSEAQSALRVVSPPETTFTVHDRDGPAVRDL